MSDSVFRSWFEELNRFTFKSQPPRKKTIWVNLTTLAICVTLGSFGFFGPAGAFMAYTPAVLLWLTLDLVRAKRSL